MRWLLLVMAVSALVTYLSGFPVRALGAKVVPMEIRDRDVHVKPIPRIGGLAIGAGLIVALLLASRLEFFAPVFSGAFEIPAITICTVALIAVGLVDDIWGLDWMLKLALQILVAVYVSMNGVQILSLPLNGLVIGSSTASTVLTVIIIVAVMNAINFIDGLDGLAAGVTAIGALAFFYYAWDLSSDQYNYASDATLITVVLIGACIGFLPHNFNPAKTFMGDTGSQLLGFYMASASLLITGRIDPETVNIHSIPAFMPIILPFLVLLLPIVDITFAVFRRLMAGKSPFEADRKHLHHRMMDLGHSHRNSVLILYAWAALFAFGGMIFIYMRGRWAIIILAVVAIVMLMITLGPKIVVPKIFEEVEEPSDEEHYTSELKIVDGER